MNLTQFPIEIKKTDCLSPASPVPNAWCAFQSRYSLASAHRRRQLTGNRVGFSLLCLLPPEGGTKHNMDLDSLLECKLRLPLKRNHIPTSCDMRTKFYNPYKPISHSKTNQFRKKHTRTRLFLLIETRAETENKKRGRGTYRPPPRLV